MQPPWCHAICTWNNGDSIECLLFEQKLGKLFSIHLCFSCSFLPKLHGNILFPYTSDTKLSIPGKSRENWHFNWHSTLGRTAACFSFHNLASTSHIVATTICSYVSICMGSSKLPTLDTERTYASQSDELAQRWVSSTFLRGNTACHCKSLADCWLGVLERGCSCLALNYRCQSGCICPVLMGSLGPLTAFIRINRWTNFFVSRCYANDHRALHVRRRIYIESVNQQSFPLREIAEQMAAALGRVTVSCFSSRGAQSIKEISLLWLWFI